MNHASCNRFLTDADENHPTVPRRIHLLELIFLDTIDDGAQAEKFVTALLALAGQLGPDIDARTTDVIRHSAAQMYSIAADHLPGLTHWLGGANVARYVACPRTRHQRRRTYPHLIRGVPWPADGGLLELALTACQHFRFPCVFHELDTQLLHDVLLYGLREGIGWLYARAPIGDDQDLHEELLDGFRRIAAAAMAAQQLIRERIGHSARPDKSEGVLQRMAAHHVLVLSQSDRTPQVRGVLSTNAFGVPTRP